MSRCPIGCSGTGPRDIRPGAHLPLDAPRRLSLNFQPQRPAHQPRQPAPAGPGSGFKSAPPQPGVDSTDPYTPMLRAYEGDNVQIRNLVGAHMGPHAFHIHGLNWQFEPSLDSSGFRSTQGMGLSEHYEFCSTCRSPASRKVRLPVHSDVGFHRHSVRQLGSDPRATRQASPTWFLCPTARPRHSPTASRFRQWPSPRYRVRQRAEDVPRVGRVRTRCPGWSA